MHHLKVDANRIYIPRNEGRRGMIWLNWASTIGQHKYLRTKTYWMLQLVLTNDKTKKLNWISARPSASVTLPFTYPHILTLLTSNSLLSMMIASLALVIQLSLTYPHVPDEAQMNNHQASYLVSICLIFVFTLTTLAKILMRSELVKLLPLLHISPRIRSIVCKIIVVHILLYRYCYMQCNAFFSHVKNCFKNIRCFIWVQK